MEYTLKRSKNRTRSAALQVSPSGEVIVQAPWYMPRFVINRFVEEHERWIAKRLIEIKKPAILRIKQFASEEELAQFIQAKLDFHQRQMNLWSKAVIFKHVKTYWGCCMPDGRIAFNLELIYAPKSAVEYVVIHELAHLKYRGHGKRFWDLVIKYCPQTKEMKKALRAIGHSTLQAI